MASFLVLLVPLADLTKIPNGFWYHAIVVLKMQALHSVLQRSSS